jgi:hypothetical protein
LLLVGLLLIPSLSQAAAPAHLLESFADPPTDCRPHTRWWWMGNAITKDDISLQLREMHAQGIGGVEQITMQPVYEKGNVPYLSDAYFDLLKHTVAEARDLGMSVSLNFGGPGWIWGGDWVPPDQRNQSLLSSSMRIQGPAHIDQALPLDATINPRDMRSYPRIEPEDRLIAVVAGRERDGVLDPNSLIEITARVRDRRLQWNVPEGAWRLMAFWATIPEGGNAVNHIDKQAMAHYVEYLGAKYAGALGGEFGKTIDSLFGDSFEVPVHRNGIYWSDTLPDEFAARKGYDLITRLPAIWWEVGEIAPKIRYDVNHVLHQLGMDAFFETFTTWCTANNVKSRVQPYGFVTDNLEGAGAVDLPEMEITAGEKDAVPWFDTRIGPKKYVASGAHLYGRNIVTTEAYTYLHWEPYRATLEELKISSDIFLRSGANKFYNHGFIASPERDIAPSRGFYAAIHISPDNVWWRYYRHLSDYIARACFLLRQGRFHADVAIYSPLANQWTKDALNARRWTRDFDWGDLGRLLISNGYDFDLINDDALQRLASFDGPALRVGEMAYSMLILPKIEALPLASLEQIEAYVKQGGILIALERVPEASCGLANHERNDQKVREIVGKLFDKPAGRNSTGEHAYGTGKTYWLAPVMHRGILDRHSAQFDPFLKVLRGIVRPDMAIDFVRYDLRENDGLACIHRTSDQRDIYFVTNVQDRPVDMDVTFRVSDAAPWQWDPYTGDVRPLHQYEELSGGTSVPLNLQAYASTFLLFERGEARPHVTATDFESIRRVDDRQIEAETGRNGRHSIALAPKQREVAVDVAGVPAPLALTGPWRLVLEAPWFSRRDRVLTELVSWTEFEDLRHFSGTGTYEAEFDLPEVYVADDISLSLVLGDVGNVAGVRINNKPAGVAWMRGQDLDVTGLVKPGVNKIAIDVTNTLINRVAGLEELPPVPEPLQPRFGKGLHEEQSPARKLVGFEPLPRSGLLGPVEIRSRKTVVVDLNNL